MISGDKLSSGGNSAHRADSQQASLTEDSRLLTSTILRLANSLLLGASQAERLSIRATSQSHDLMGRGPDGVHSRCHAAYLQHRDQESRSQWPAAGTISSHRSIACTSGPFGRAINHATRSPH
ncbi:hypothetical protein LA080_008099 [Diaporthe eres]|nr:hypothetical protein LA080_008099 [Diaporthe eres]